jgi:hypothetical protein
MPFTPREAIHLVTSMKKLGGDIPTRRLMQATVGFRSLVAWGWAAFIEMEEHDPWTAVFNVLSYCLLNGMVIRDSGDSVARRAHLWRW